MTAVSLPQIRPLAGVPPRAAWGLALAAAAAVLYVLFRGQYTLPHDDEAPVFVAFNDLRAFIDANRNSNPVLVVFITGLRTLITVVIEASQAILQGLTWPGLTALGGVLGFLVGGWRMATFLTAGFLSFGILGLWGPSVDTLALTLAAVALSLAIGIPLGIVAGRSDRFMRLITPVLDFMQVMPTFAYLSPLALFFLIGPATAGIATMIYAIPPAIRITALGIRGVSATTVEAAAAMGSTRLQVLRKVQLPMARKTIVLAINQTVMMALAMVVITALVDAPGLGKNIIGALQTVDVGEAFDAGLAIVIMAIMLDRLTTRASERVDPANAGAAAARAGETRRNAIVSAVVVAAAVIAGNLALGGSDFPDAVRFSFRDPVNSVTAWIETNLFVVTSGIKDVFTYGLINPLQGVLTTSPWWLAAAVIAGIAALVGGVRTAITTVACLALLIALQLWEHSMETLATVLVAAVLTLLVGLLFGIWSARSDRFAAVLRPMLDAAQTMPSFVYLLPALALFGPTRFTAIVAALIYAVPPVIRLIDAGIRGVPATISEAATAAGSTRRQLLWKVQLPVARPALLLAANQGIILVLAMVVVGGLVGAGALGYDVVAGFARRDFFGEGLAAGLAIVVLGVMLDRITQSAGQRRSVLGTAARLSRAMQTARSG
jgi:glycine betaine/proline transport system permease protein